MFFPAEGTVCTPEFDHISMGVDWNVRARVV